MAFSSIPSALINVGKAVKKEIFTYIKDNFDDHESRINSLEGGSSGIVIFDEIVVNAASLFDGGSITGLDYYRASSNFSLLTAIVYIFEVGTITGTLEIDFQKSSSADFTSSVSVFTTKPSVNYSTASDYDESSNAVFDSGVQDISTGDYLRFDITQLPTGYVGKFGIYLVGEAN